MTGDGVRVRTHIMRLYFQAMKPAQIRKSESFTDPLRRSECLLVPKVLSLVTTHDLIQAGL